MDTKYYLSFDCATKTFAYILVKINFKYLSVNITELKKIANKLLMLVSEGNINDDIIESINKLDNNTKYAITIIKADCVDLCPTQTNKDIDTVTRIKAVILFVKNEIHPLIIDIPISDVIILIEFQMSYNTQSKVISIALISLFHEYQVNLVNPSLKNKVFFNEEGRHYHFIESNKNTYIANKKHALYNFKYFESVFQYDVNLSDSLKGHVSDAFMQILGHIYFNKKN